MMDDFKPASLTAEHSILDVYRLSRHIRQSKFNWVVTFVVFIFLVSYTYIVQDSYSVMSSKLESLIDLGIDLTIKILAFLLAGFIFFSSFSKRELLLAMARIEYGKTGLSYLKYGFFTFMNVFIYYLLFAVLCVMAKLVGGEEGLIIRIVSLFSINDELSKLILLKSSFIFFGTYLFYLLILLKSFIFNLYHLTMSSVRWECEKSEDSID